MRNIVTLSIIEQKQWLSLNWRLIHRRQPSFRVFLFHIFLLHPLNNRFLSNTYQSKSE
jgi:hypothetical protein